MFDRATFVEDLATRIAEHLRARAPEFKQHRLGAIAVTTAPWHKATGLSALIETDECRKWDIGAWEHQEFADLDGSLIMLPAYEELQDPEAKGSGRYAPYFRACAEALCLPKVRDALELYALEPDFELFVDDPDDPNEVNYCEEFVGVDVAKRKPKTDIVNNLDEALKDPASVRVLKFWYRGSLTAEDDERIAQLVNLEELHLVQMGLTTLPACVRSLRRLHTLTLDFNQLKNLAGLSGLRQLRSVSLRNNGQLTPGMARELVSLPDLRQLRLGFCGLHKIPGVFKRLRALEEIYLFGNSFSLIPAWLPALPNLKKLGLVEAATEVTKDHFRAKHPHLEIW